MMINQDTFLNSSSNFFKFVSLLAPIWLITSEAINDPISADSLYVILFVIPYKKPAANASPAPVVSISCFGFIAGVCITT